MKKLKSQSIFEDLPTESPGGLCARPQVAITDALQSLCPV